MKQITTKRTLAVVFLMLGSQLAAQVTNASNNSSVFSDDPYVGWSGTGPFTVARPLSIRNNYVGFPIDFTTGGANSMILTGTVTGTGVSRSLGLGVPNPLAKFHLSSDNTGFLIRTDGLGTQNNDWSLYTGGTERFRLRQLAGTNNAELGTVANGALQLKTNNLARIHITGGADNGIGSGFVGLNMTDPEFHLDILTQERSGGEYLLRTRVEGDSLAYFGVVNLSGQNNTSYIPGLLSKQSNNDAAAFTTIGSIEDNQDEPADANNESVTRFISTHTYDPVADDFSLERVNTITNRRIFEWFNGPNRLMTMRANGFLGVGTITPGNRVEINSDFFSTTGQGAPLTTPVTAATNNTKAGLNNANATGFSGLRLTDLTSASNPESVNPGKGVLAVDANGDVIYVAAAGGASAANNGLSVASGTNTTVFGQNLNEAGSPAKLISKREIPMNNFDLVFTDGAGGNNTKNLVGIGESIPEAKLHVSLNNGIQNNPTGLIVENNSDKLNDRPFGSKVSVLGTNNAYNTGMYVEAANSEAALGVHSIVRGDKNSYGISASAENGVSNNQALIGVARSSTPSNSGNIGAYAQAYNGSRNWGGYFYSELSAANPNSSQSVGALAWSNAKNPNAVSIGLFASVSSGGVGTGKNAKAVYGQVASNITNGYAGYFSGNVHVTGKITYGVSCTRFSDSILKLEIEPIENALSTIGKLRPTTYFMDSVNFQEQLRLNGKRQYGLIAQEVERVLPELVTENYLPAVFDSSGVEIAPEHLLKSISYEALIPISIKGIQEQQLQIDSIIAVLPTGSGTSGADNGLSVNSGNVVLGQDLNQVGSPAQLSSNRQIPLNNNNISFTAGTTLSNTANSVGIGVLNPTARLHVDMNGTATASELMYSSRISNSVAGAGSVYGQEVRVNGASNNNFGQDVRISGGTNQNVAGIFIASGGLQSTGVSAAVSGSSTLNTAVGATATGGTSTVGLNISATNGTNDNRGISANVHSANSAANYGAFLQSYGGVTNYGLYGEINVAGGTSYGVYGKAPVQANHWAGYFQGNTHVTGTLSSTSGTVVTSDSQFKTNVEPEQNATAIIAQLAPKTYYYDTLSYKDRFQFSGHKQHGFIAQEVEAVLSELVTNNIAPATYDSLGNMISPAMDYKGLNYTGFISLLTKGMQEQQEQVATGQATTDSLTAIVAAQDMEIQGLNDRLTQLENCLSALLPTLCQMNQSVIESNTPATQEQLRTNLAINLSDKNAIILDQNVPNPFAEKTTINFSIPATVKIAQILFYNDTGVLMNTLNIGDRGLGSVTVYGADLSSGTYSYTLIADSQVVASKKMIKL